MTIAERKQGDWTVLHLSGRIDNPGSITLKDRLVPLASVHHCHVILDFSGVLYLSSTGLRVLLIAAQQAQAARGMLRICGVSPAIRDFFKMSGLDKVLKIYASPFEAMH